MLIAKTRQIFATRRGTLFVCSTHLSRREILRLWRQPDLMRRDAAADETNARKIQRSRAALHVMVSDCPPFHGRYREADRFHL
jgi:hypothetical protein